MWFVCIYDSEAVDKEIPHVFATNIKEDAERYVLDTKKFWKETEYIDMDMESYKTCKNTQGNLRVIMTVNNGGVADINVFEGDQFSIGDKVVVYYRSYDIPLLADPDDCNVLQDLIDKHGGELKDDVIDLIEDDFGEKCGYVTWIDGDRIVAFDAVIEELPVGSVYS